MIGAVIEDLPLWEIAVKLLGANVMVNCLIMHNSLVAMSYFRLVSVRRSPSSPPLAQLEVSRSQYSQADGRR
jgi:hypothetical protein